MYAYAEWGQRLVLGVDRSCRQVASSQVFRSVMFACYTPWQMLLADKATLSSLCILVRIDGKGHAHCMPPHMNHIKHASRSWSSVQNKCVCWGSPRKNMRWHLPQQSHLSVYMSARAYVTCTFPLAGREGWFPTAYVEYCTPLRSLPFTFEEKSQLSLTGEAGPIRYVYEHLSMCLSVYLYTCICMYFVVCIVQWSYFKFQPMQNSGVVEDQRFTETAQSF